MAGKKGKRQPRKRSDVHATLDADVAAKLRAFAAYTGRDLGDVLAEALRPVLRGFTVRLDGPGTGPAPADGAEAA